jgi:hypothetical protein
MRPKKQLESFIYGLQTLAESVHATAPQLRIPFIENPRARYFDSVPSLAWTAQLLGAVFAPGSSTAVIVGPVAPVGVHSMLQEFPIQLHTQLSRQRLRPLVLIDRASGRFGSAGWLMDGKSSGGYPCRPEQVPERSGGGWR